MACTGDGAGVYGIGLGLPGLQAQFAAVRNADRNAVAIPDGISDDTAVLLTDNLPTGWCAARQSGVRPGGTVTVVGLGPVGLCAVMAALAMGAGRVLAIDPLPDRPAAAERLGAEGVSGDDVVTGVQDLIAGRKTDSVIDAVGSDDAIQCAIQLAAVGGSVAVAGVSGRSHTRASDDATLRDSDDAEVCVVLGAAGVTHTDPFGREPAPCPRAARVPPFRTAGWGGRLSSFRRPETWNSQDGIHRRRLITRCAAAQR
jgi:threonine dehydrogenase-like Zn-dependent dehydrogenase